MVIYMYKNLRLQLFPYHYFLNNMSAKENLNFTEMD